MIPLAWIFFAWLGLVVIFGIMALLTLVTTARYGLSCGWTYLSAGIFLLGSMAIIFLTLSYAANLDLSQAFDLSALF